MKRDDQWIKALKTVGIHALVKDGEIRFKHVVLGERKAIAAGKGQNKGQR